MTEDESQTLKGVYLDADSAVKGFQDACGVSCPEGCGICCTRFTPDILPVEADYLALWMMVNEPDRLKVLCERSHLLHQNSDVCPLYIPDKDLHCSVYEGRPLICRLFGFSAMKTKKELLEFSDCRHMPMPEENYRGKNWEIGGEGAPPAADIYGRRILAIRPLDGPRREILPTALARSVSKLYLMRNLTDWEKLNKLTS